MSSPALISEIETPELLTYLYPRMIHFGVSYADLTAITERTNPFNWTSWSNRLGERGMEFARLAWNASVQRRQVTAAEYARRATDYLHFAQMRHPSKPVREAYQSRSREYFERFLRLTSPDHILVQVPISQGHCLPGYLRWLQRDAPCVVLFGGLDSSKECELFYFSEVFLHRGFSVLCGDWPGQGELRGKIGLLDCFDESVSAVMDFLTQHPVVAPSRIGVFGVSLGGYLALRASAMDGRISACISVGGFHDYRVFRNLQEQAKPFLSESLRPGSEAGLDATVRAVSLKALTGQSKAATLVVHGDADHLVSNEQIDLLRSWASAVEVRVLPGAEHVCTSRFSILLPQVGDWMVKHLGS